MAELLYWDNGAQGSYVKKVIETNFENINKQVTELGQNYNRYTYSFKESDWKNGVIDIDYSEYLKKNPCVDLYIKNGDNYSSVYGGYEITNNGIELQSDIAYEGKVVIR